jgi:hypothetical protein
MQMLRGWVIMMLFALAMPSAGDGAPTPPAPAPKRAPLFRDFMGLNVHTYQFRPDLYAPVCRLVRDYHNLHWDIGQDSDYSPQFPLSRNGVDWGKLYGDWRRAGYGIDVCVQFYSFPAEAWKDLPRDAYAYGLSFARFFGVRGLAESVEIGNEPEYDDATYRALFENMARGIRKGDPKLKIATCAATAGPSERYAKSLACVRGLEDLYDIVNVHTYALAENYPTWRRSYPEDPSIKYLKDVKEAQAWRDANAPGKEVWITEFGWDASTKPAPATGDHSRWVGSTETQQAQYLVRSFLVFAATGVDRAYIFFFNDQDEAQFHGSSGLTRDYHPKPSFHAVAHAYRTLGNYRLARVVVQRPEDLYLYEFQRGDDEREGLWVAWSPTGSGRTCEISLPAPPGEILRAERMPLKEGAAEPVAWHRDPDGTVRLLLGESPAYLWFRFPATPGP